MNAKKNIFFSLIIPLYNNENLIEDCIKSVANQDYQNFEAIIIDDGSTDSSYNIAQKLQQKYSFIKLWHKDNGGPASARNFGLKKASGQYISYLDSDDQLRADYFSTLNKTIINNGLPDIVIFNYELHVGKKFFPTKLDIFSKNIRIKPGLYNKQRLEKEIYPNFFIIRDFKFTNCRGIYKADLIKKHYNKDESIFMGEDDCYVYECTYYANSIYFLENVLYTYNRNVKDSIVMTSKIDINYLVKIYDYLFNHLYNKNKVIDKQLIYSFLSDFVYIIYKLQFKCKIFPNNRTIFLYQKFEDTKKINGVYKLINENDIKRLYKIAAGLKIKSTPKIYYKAYLTCLKIKSLKFAIFLSRISFPLYKIRIKLITKNETK